MITNDPITLSQAPMLTSAAADKVRQLIETEGDPDLALRLAVKSGGCSGFSYEMYFDSTTDDDDIVTETDGIRLLVDPSSVELVMGAKVDFKDSGLQGSGFAIENPGQARSCGCGQSFC